MKEREHEMERENKSMCEEEGVQKGSTRKRGERETAKGRGEKESEKERQRK